MEPVEETRDRPVSLEWVIGLSNFRPNFDGFSEHVTFQGGLTVAKTIAVF